MHMFGDDYIIFDATLETKKKLKPELIFLKDIHISSDISEVIYLISFYFLNCNFLMVLILCSLYGT